MPPVPNENDSVGVKILVSKEPVDIENLLKLNPRIKPHANAVPSAVTKKVKLYPLYLFRMLIQQLSKDCNLRRSIRDKWKFHINC